MNDVCPAKDAATPDRPVPESLLLSEIDVARLCGVSRVTVRRWKAAGLIIPVELPFGIRRNLYRRADLEIFVASLPSGDDAEGLS